MTMMRRFVVAKNFLIALSSILLLILPSSSESFRMAGGRGGTSRTASVDHASSINSSIGRRAIFRHRPSASSSSGAPSASASVLAATTTRGGGDNDKQSGSSDPNNNVDLKSMQMDSVKALRSCIKVVVFSVIVDAVTDAWALREATRVERILELLSVVWKFSFVFGLRRLLDYMTTELNRPIGDKKDGNNNVHIGSSFSSMVDADYQIMSHVWRQTAYIVALQCVAEVARIVQHRQVIIGWAVHPVILAFAALLLALAAIVRDASVQDTQNITSAVQPWKRRRNIQEEDLQPAKNGVNGPVLSSLSSSSSSVIVTTQQKVDVTALNMALCAAALAVQGLVVIPLTAMDQSSLSARIFSLTDAYSPSLIAFLLWRLRKALLGVYRSALVQDEKKPAIRAEIELCVVEKRFHTEVAGTLGMEAALKLLATIVPLLQPIVMPIVQSVFATLTA